MSTPELVEQLTAVRAVRQAQAAGARAKTIARSNEASLTLALLDDARAAAAQTADEDVARARAGAVLDPACLANAVRLSLRYAAAVREAERSHTDARTALAEAEASCRAALHQVDITDDLLADARDALRDIRGTQLDRAIESYALLRWRAQ
ncbi:hypothetical protein P3W85_28315 [Cupriavidus basilensis]|uniref:Uncharacterized protein n=1 Tax=Cupriavidus basilensis TaxID=68895 RepID=A0ABT6AW22_9BURK|nr:hypothetical protein [Cupriavidus basilensis]MDF3836825.1 hypothetical protein [Cupriavidus basilensis]